MPSKYNPVAHTGFTAAVLLALTLPGFCPQAAALFSQDDTGTTAGNFLKIPVGARSLAMGGAFAAAAEGAAALWWNPAGMLVEPNRETLLESQLLNKELLFNTLAHSEPLGEKDRLGVMVNTLTWNTPLPGYDNTGRSIGEVAYEDMAFAVGYATNVFEVPFGFTLKAISSKLQDSSALGFCGDVGFQQGFLKNDLLIGLSLKNIGGKLAWADEGYPLPFLMQGGAAYRLLHQDLTVSAEFQAPFDQMVHAHLGVELVRNLGLPLSLALRAGYHTDWQGYAASANGFTAGAGLEWRIYQRALARVGRMVGYREERVFMLGVDYAWTPNDQLDASHHLTLRLSF